MESRPIETVMRLGDYFFPHVKVVADPAAGGEHGDPVTNFSVDVDAKKVDGENSYQVSVVVKSIPAPEPKKIPYLIELVAVGFFEVNSDWPDPIKLLEINGATILYSAAREFLITITSRGPWGAIPLPATSFLALYNHKISTREQKESGSRKGEKEKSQESNTPTS